MEEYTMPGTGTIQDVLVAQITIDTDATGGLNLAMSRPAEVYDVAALPATTVGGGTVTVANGTSGVAITDAMTFAAIGTVARAATIDNAQNGAPAILRFTTANAGDFGTVTVYLRTPSDSPQTLTP
jgi:hypothetical protein